ncbi:hypothetical protein HDU67_008573, partial [Dinochytrium kinnereticum]
VVFGETTSVPTIDPVPTSSAESSSSDLTPTNSLTSISSSPSGSALPTNSGNTIPVGDNSTATTLSSNPSNPNAPGTTPSNSANAIGSSNVSAPLSTPAVAGIALGVVAVLAAAGAFILIFFRRRRSEKKPPIVGMPAAPLNYEPSTPPCSFMLVPPRAEQSFENGVTGQSPLVPPPRRAQPPLHPNSSLFDGGIVGAGVGGSVGAGKWEYGVKADEVESWTVEQVVGWLHRNRINPLVLKSFQENSITGLSLLSLTEHHMEHSMGIHSLGDRLAISSLIATLRNDQPQPQTSSAPSWVTSEKAGGEEGRSTMVQLGSGSEKVMAPPPYENGGV